MLTDSGYFTYFRLFGLLTYKVTDLWLICSVNSSLYTYPFFQQGSLFISLNNYLIHLILSSICCWALSIVHYNQVKILCHWALSIVHYNQVKILCCWALSIVHYNQVQILCHWALSIVHYNQVQILCRWALSIVHYNQVKMLPIYSSIS